MTTLLLVHIIGFSLSLILLPALIIATVSNYSLPRVLRITSMLTTVVGLVSGSALLVASPSGAYCALLFAYVVVFTVFYVRASTVAPQNSPAPATIDR